MAFTWKNFKEKILGQKGLLFIGLADIVGTGITSLFWLYIASIFDPAEYGQIMYLLGIASLVQLISLIGNSNTLTVYSAKEIKIQSTLFFINLVATAVSLCVLTVVLNRVDTSFLVIGYIMFSMVNSILLGKKFFAKYGKIILLQKILTVTFGLGFYFGFNVDGIIYGLALSYIPYLIIFIKEFKMTKIDFSLLKTRKKFIINNYVMNLSVGLENVIDKIIIVPILGFALLGNYSLAMQIFTMLMIFSTIIYKYILPLDSRGESNKKIKQWTLVFSIFVTILGITVVPIGIDMLFPKFIEVKDTVQLMSLAIVPATISMLYGSKFLGKEKSNYILITKLCSVAIVVIGFLLFGPIYGIFGLTLVLISAYVWEAVFLFIMNRISEK